MAGAIVAAPGLCSVYAGAFPNAKGFKKPEYTFFLFRRNFCIFFYTKL
jgi:hypothetical protein